MSSQRRNSRNPRNLRCTWICLFLLFFAPTLADAREPQSTTDTAAAFRWIHSGTDPQLWEQIVRQFNQELTPDQVTPGSSEADTYRYKYLQKVGLFNHSALVIVGQRPVKDVTKGNEWNVVYSAFNFDILTGRKSSIENAGWLWQWKFVKLANFGPTSAPDVTFTYLTCTECEPDFMFSSFYYDEGKSEWRMRPWGDGKDLWWTASDGLVVELDLIGDSDLIYFDCVYGILNSQDARFQNLAVRCKEFTETDTGESKVADNTVLYSLLGGQFKGRRVTDASEAISLTQQICRPGVKSFLCRLRATTPPTAGQHEMLRALFPKASVAVRDAASFQSLKRTMTMSEIASKYGLPDEFGGSGIYVFTYHLKDGTFVNISAEGTDSPILYANRIDADGRRSDVISEK